MKQRGFTVIELVVIIALVAVGGFLFYSEKSRVTGVQRDAARKISINAMYYNLEEVYYPTNGYYPVSIDSKTLRAMDPGLFADPMGNKLGTSDSDFRYEATGCTTDGKCKGYTLRAHLEREADYIKTNRNNS